MEEIEIHKYETGEIFELFMIAGLIAKQKLIEKNGNDQL